ncbi:MAG: acyl-CoA synthetase [Ramlibacter sp.]|nr:acyl-CoA synthetase [Ramlibacter sp.]
MRSLADIEALERTPYEQAIPARTTWGLITHAAQRFAERTALRYLPGADLQAAPRDVSYAELASQVRRAANLFRSLGVGPDDAVAILAPNIPETQFALWGAQLAGRACPINYLLQPEHIAALLAASGARVVVALGPNAELDLWPTVQKVQALHPLPLLQIAVQDGATAPQTPVFQELLARQPEALAFDPQLTPDRVAACFHTGGTTGAPKLAQHTHGNEAHTSWFAHHYYGFDEHTVEINGFPLFHVAGAFVYGLSLLAIGATQVLPTLSGMRNPAFVRHYWKFCERERVTALACVPTIMATLLNLPVDADIASVRVAYTGGSPLPLELAAQFESRLGIAVRNILGMTECAGLVSIEPAGAPRVPGSTGLRLPYTQVRVVPWRDGAAQRAEDCPAGDTGVVILRGPHVSPGYTDTARNAGMFEGDWLISGDLGHIDAQGYLHLTGRAKDVIIRGSHNIDPGLVEEAFLAHPAVALCAVVGEPDAYAGELPVAFVTLKPGAQCSAAALLAEVSPQVYERPAVPKRVTLLDAMPVTAIGKIYKPTLRLRAIEAKLAEMLADVPGVTVLAQEDGGRLSARVTLPDLSQEASIRERLAAIAVPVQFSAPQ